MVSYIHAVCTPSPYTNSLHVHKDTIYKRLAAQPTVFHVMLLAHASLASASDYALQLASTDGGKEYWFISVFACCIRSRAVHMLLTAAHAQYMYITGHIGSRESITCS